ncbi:beta-ketoacyl synthase chain length factor [Phytobacter diazotrophicus]|uniref:beta-ketoacyl synthase chain length factor n=1 Tax=Phytobacter diazotrophicus TaxID=395631 RepID=UPI00232D97EA|nr:beta-ketoacyl synthase chain length factor [Phytobacter diazotrophicus]MDC0729022.1 beta-ketoacyl synthase chain length factor [Phytobacter diazotrophicus]MDC0736278.1 beta-ketoacyl synthase chain length factor [Phytobacter diazotrophicus]
MKFALKLVDWQARAPGLCETPEWQQWAQQPHAINPDAPQAKLTELPMMTARRLSSGSKLAVECGLSMLRRHTIDAVLYTSRHGELERNYSILSALAKHQDVSPTDFAMSVHNSSVGNLTITAKHPIVSSSLSAGMDTFQQGLCEVITLLHAGFKRVLMVDFDGYLPDFYHSDLPEKMPTWPFAVALVFSSGEELQCTTQSGSDGEEALLPQSVQFLQHYLSDAQFFTIMGEKTLWQWRRS